MPTVAECHALAEHWAAKAETADLENVRDKFRAAERQWRRTAEAQEGFEHARLVKRLEAELKAY